MSKKNWNFFVCYKKIPIQKYSVDAHEIIYLPSLKSNENLPKPTILSGIWNSSVVMPPGPCIFGFGAFDIWPGEVGTPSCWLILAAASNAACCAWVDLKKPQLIIHLLP